MVRWPWEEETVEQGRGYTQEREAESEVDTQGDEVEVEDEASAEVEDLGEVEDSEDEDILDEESERWNLSTTQMPADKQLYFVRSLAKRRDVEIPNVCYLDRWKAAEFIDRYRDGRQPP